MCTSNASARAMRASLGAAARMAGAARAAAEPLTQLRRVVFIAGLLSAHAVAVHGIVVERNAEAGLVGDVPEAVLQDEGLLHQVVFGGVRRVHREFDGGISRRLVGLYGHADPGPAAALVPQRDVIKLRVRLQFEYGGP